MAMRFAFNILLIFVTSVSSHSLPPRFFNVVKYGAVGDGYKDNTQAFLDAWKDACAYNGRSRVWIPNGRFLVGETSFQGSCNGSMAFLIKGTLVAPTDQQHMFTDTWIAFRYVDDLIVKGGGVLDGQGHAAWPYNDCRSNPNCKPLPVTLRFDFVRNSRVQNIQSINSKSSHFNIFACENMNISGVRISAPSDSPNTDGIHIGSSTHIKISDTVIGTGDDCISMVSGSQSIDINGVSCGPGHGISIGSLGRSHAHEYVKGITVRNSTFIGSDNGIRIKTWSPSLYSVASGFLFEDLIMQNSTKNPIVIDQRYCPSSNCYVQAGHSRSAVQIEDVVFKNIRGVSGTEIALKLECSEALPCKNVKLIDIDLAYSGGSKAMALCAHVIGTSSGKLVPGGCV